MYFGFWILDSSVAPQNPRSKIQNQEEAKQYRLEKGVVSGDERLYHEEEGEESQVEQTAPAHRAPAMCARFQEAYQKEERHHHPLLRTEAQVSVLPQAPGRKGEDRPCDKPRHAADGQMPDEQPHRKAAQDVGEKIEHIEGEGLVSGKPDDRRGQYTLSSQKFIKSQAVIQGIECPRLVQVERIGSQLLGDRANPPGGVGGVTPVGESVCHPGNERPCENYRGK